MTGPDAVLCILARLTDRDRQLLDWLADHQVLTCSGSRSCTWGTTPDIGVSRRRLDAPAHVVRPGRLHRHR
ncbi:MAG TPA: hypothetical protein VI248_16725 [Kineosporiaceae bacterium]